MSNPRVYEDYLRDMLEAMGKARSFTKGMGPGDFADDEKTVYTVVRALEIVGEAAKNVPDRVRRKYHEVPWRAMAGMRDVLAHRYFGVDTAAVWQALRKDIPAAMKAVRKIVRENKVK